MLKVPMAPWNPGMAGVSALGMASWMALTAVFGAWIRYCATELGPALRYGRPWTTWGVNMVACFLMGLLASQGSHRTSPSPGSLELIGAVGFLGSLSTFSTLTADLLTTWQRGARCQTLALGGASLLGGLLACMVGLALGRPQP
jgi:CrcB protein